MIWTKVTCHLLAIIGHPYSLFIFSLHSLYSSLFILTICPWLLRSEVNFTGLPSEWNHAKFHINHSSDTTYIKYHHKASSSLVRAHFLSPTTKVETHYSLTPVMDGRPQKRDGSINTWTDRVRKVFYIYRLATYGLKR